MDAEISRVPVYSVRDYGASGEGVELDTRCLQAAIDDCAARGGGTVLLPPGTYRTGTLVLRDAVDLHLASRATLLGSTDVADYALPAGQHDDAYQPCLLYARNAQGLSVSGKGAVDGQGASFPCVSRQQSIPAFRAGRPLRKGGRRYVRPMLAIAVSCCDVSMTGLTIRNSPSWGLHLVDCERLTFDGLEIDNRARPNGDGIDLESCRNVRISNCHISSDDDAICLKSSIAGRPCENIVVTNCAISSNCAAVKFGTPSRAGFRNVAITNCAFYDCGMGAIKLQAVDGGTLEDVTISNIAMHNVEGPIFVRLGNRGKRYRIADLTAVEDLEPSGPLPVSTLRNVLISNVQATVRSVEVTDPMLRVDVDPKSKLGIMVSGIPGHEVENITFSDVHISFPGGGTLADAAIRVPEDEAMYPEQFFFGVLPAYGAYIRHARGLTFHNVCFELASRDLRPALVCEDVEGLELSRFRAAGDRSAEGLIRLSGSRDVRIHGCRPLDEIDALVRLDGTPLMEVALSANDLRNARVVVQPTGDGRNE